MTPHGQQQRKYQKSDLNNLEHACFFKFYNFHLTTMIAIQELHFQSAQRSLRVHQRPQRKTDFVQVEHPVHLHLYQGRALVTPGECLHCRVQSLALKLDARELLLVLFLALALVLRFGKPLCLEVLLSHATSL